MPLDMYSLFTWGNRMKINITGYLFCVLILLLLGCTSDESEPIVAATATEIPQVEIIPSPTEDPFLQPRLNLVEYTMRARGIEDPDVLRAMETVPRHELVPDEYIAYAYQDHPLPIGYGQTISQPFMVAWMTELLELRPGEKVLEIGTGSGYQASILAELGFLDVYSIEIIPQLAERAAQDLEKLGYAEVHLMQGDGYFGWEEHAPFDAIIVTAAPDHLPLPLTQQLVEGGRLVIPIGPPGGYQSLWKFINEGGEMRGFNLGGVSFVPLTRDAGEE